MDGWRDGWGELLCILSFRHWCKCLEEEMQFPSLETTYRKTDNFNYISSHYFVLMHDMIEPVWLQCAMSSTWTKVDTIKPLKMIDCDFGEKMSSCKILDFILKSLRTLQPPLPVLHQSMIFSKKWLTSCTYKKKKISSQLLAHLCIPRWKLQTADYVFKGAYREACYCTCVFFFTWTSHVRADCYNSKSHETLTGLERCSQEPEGNHICSLWRLPSAVWAKSMATYVKISTC